MSTTTVTEEFDSEGNLVKRTTTTETGDTYTPYLPWRPNVWADIGDKTYLIS